MKKLFLLIAVFVFVGSAFAQRQQNLFTVTYTTLCADTIAIAGSTDAGSDWFTAKGFENMYVEISNGNKYFQYELAANDLKTFDKFKVMMEGSDTTLTIEANTNDATAPDVSIVIPVFSTGTTYSYKLDFGGDGSTLGVATSVFIVRFKGVNKY